MVFGEEKSRGNEWFCLTAHQIYNAAVTSIKSVNQTTLGLKNGSGQFAYSDYLSHFFPRLCEWPSQAQKSWLEILSNIVVIIV